MYISGMCRRTRLVDAWLERFGGCDIDAAGCEHSKNVAPSCPSLLAPGESTSPLDIVMRAFPVNTTPILTPDVSIHRGELGAAPEIRLGERPNPARGCDASATVHTAPLSGSGQGAHGEVGHGKRALGCYGVCLPTELSWRMPDIGSAQLEQPVLRRQCSEVSIASASSRSVTKRRWSELDRAKHSAACRAKSRLTLNEKLEIIRLFESTDLAERKTQKELAELFGKSRMTISSVLRPDSIARCRQMAAGGVRGDAKRCKRPEGFEFESKVLQAVGGGREFTTKNAIISAAETLACKYGVRNFQATDKWYMRFVQQHNVPITEFSPATRHSSSSLMASPLGAFDAPVFACLASSATATTSAAAGTSLPVKRASADDIDRSDDSPHWMWWGERGSRRGFQDTDAVAEGPRILGPHGR